MWSDDRVLSTWIVRSAYVTVASCYRSIEDIIEELRANYDNVLSGDDPILINNTFFNSREDFEQLVQSGYPDLVLE